MSPQPDFERHWLNKFSSSLKQVVGDRTRDEVMQGSDTLSSNSSREKIIRWTRQAINRLDSLVDEENRRSIMTSCSCQYPTSDLQQIRKAYEQSRDVDVALRMLQEQFERFLTKTLKLDEEHIKTIVNKRWGLAGVRMDNKIVATKIPKSGYLAQYMRETDPNKKRQLYCHCPRIRDALRTSESIPVTYCYCGAGFYKGIWEEILQEPVEIELLSSVLQGDEACSFAICLPAAH